MESVGVSNYGASASSPGGGEGEGESELGDGWWSAIGDTRENRGVGEGSARRESLNDRFSQQSGPSKQPVQTRRPLSILHHALPATYTLLPLRIGLPRTTTPTVIDRKGKGKAWDVGVRLTRRRCESGLLLGGVGWGIWKLGCCWQERALAGEISLLLGLSVLYTALRVRPGGRRPKAPSPTPSYATAGRSGSPVPSPGYLRDRSARMSNGHMATPSPVGRDDMRSRIYAGSGSEEEESKGIGARGCVWGTEEREYRECLDDGVLFALLLSPLVASAMLHSAFSQLIANPDQALLPGWLIEHPLLLASTPLRPPPSHSSIPFIPSDALKALSALATSRRNLVQLFTLCSFVLLVQLSWSLRLEVKLSKTPMSGINSALAGANGGNTSMESTGATGTYWLRKGEWRRNLSVIGMAFLVTGGCLVVKVVTAYIGHGVWSDMSPSDIVIATLFYQFSLYVCVRLARRGFTLGELGVVSNAATALFMETVNLTRMKIRILRTPYIKTYRLPTPLLTFQLALIPGSLLAGLILSPLLYLSRHLAQRPARRLKFPHEKPIHRRLLALGFYAGSLIVCVGLVGTWTRWLLNWRDPFVWVVMFLLDGKRWWTRLALMGYWGGLAMISVAGWNRQLNRVRRHRSYLLSGKEGEGDKGSGSGGAGGGGEKSGAGVGNGSGGLHSAAGEGTGFSGVATQMMDRADQRIPTLSVNAKRKFFHALAVVMFVPGIAIDPAFTHLSFSVAFAAFNFAEYIRYFALWPFGVSVHLFLNEFLDHKDSGTAILSHFYLLAGCASPLWLEGSTQILSFYGVVSLGIGDALASIVGRRLGHTKWCSSSGKTIEGSVTFFISVLVSSIMLWGFGWVDKFDIGRYALTTFMATLLEGFSAQNDNLILPMFGWAMGTLLGV